MASNLYLTNLEDYNNLSEIEQSIVNIMAIVFHPLTEEEIYNEYQLCLGKITKASFSQAIKTLVKKFKLNLLNYNILYLDTEFHLSVFYEITSKPNNLKYYDTLLKKYSKERNEKVYFGYWDLNKKSYIILRDFLIKNITQKKELTSEDFPQFTDTSDLLKNYFSQMVFLSEYYEILIKLPSNFFISIISSLHRYSIEYQLNFNELSEFYTFILNYPDIVKEKYNLICSTQAEIFLYQGCISKAEALIPSPKTNLDIVILSVIELYKGNYTKTNDNFKITLKNNSKYLKTAGCPISYITHILISWILEPTEINLIFLKQQAKNFEKYEDYKKQCVLPFHYFLLKELDLCDKVTDELINNIKNEEFTYFSYTAVLYLFITDNKCLKQIINWIEAFYEILIGDNMLLMARELCYIITEIDPSNKKLIKNLESLNQKIEVPLLLTRIKKKENWEQTLEDILFLLNIESQTKPKQEEKTCRIAYFVDFNNYYFQPVLQNLNANGRWSKGRNISLKRLKENEVEGISDQDRNIALAIKNHSNYYGSNDYFFDYNKLLPELPGHPYLFLYDNPEISVELIKSEPEIYAEKTKKGYLIKTNIPKTDKNYLIVKETNTLYRFYNLTNQHLKVFSVLNRDTILIPEKGKNKLMETISNLGTLFSVHSDISGTSNPSIKTIDGDSRLRVQILPIGDTLKAEVFIKPLNTEPPYTKPGKGGQVIYGTLNSEKCQAIRDLKSEVENAEKLSNALTIIENANIINEPVIFEDPYECLSLLETIESLKDIALIEWPEGERFRVKKYASFNNLKLSIKGKSNWFELDGELNIDENTVLKLKDLLELTRKSKGRFIELEKGEFLSITNDLKKRIDELNSFVHLDKNGIILNKFATQTIQEISANAASFATDKNWKDFQKKIKNSVTKNFTIPSNLEAELRPYQEDGFMWMSRLAEWNAGACLADDMGLGKTIQTIAILLQRADIGPALVVCPASVLPNWLNEITKFAPSLNSLTLGSNNRNGIFENISNSQVLIITYGLLQSEEKRISEINWATVVLDEAHAIKNTQTKSSKAAMSIKADFRIALTGTPIQNNLGELWNLFNFCNPGLLGTLQQFNQHFITPIEKENNQVLRQHLKKLLSPFILRRTKGAVLDDLPPKSEITRKIDLSEEEIAFYEALRQKAIENIETDEGPKGQKHLRALAEITKLRLACCNSALVDANINLSSSKLEAFLEIIEDLKMSNHRALVFSQFIGHLDIVRKELDKLKIHYLYLDGSTPIPEREKAVKNFQTGIGDVFLISLKAGGLGLNLTAADYVIHLDPWWNPAIEDQASDRAHRIGQKRPVTIYRLVAAGTIEEKILQLHASKRDIADSLLEGSDKSANLSTEDLLNLLKEF
jgi:SNF2 family DNA or RNA helicase